jgi:hypothetical protein
MKAAPQPNGERKGPLEGGPLSLSPSVYNFYSRMSFHAAGTIDSLYESWKRSKRHNKRIERAALWHTVLLDEDCGKALKPTHKSLLLPPSADVQTRYELQAGIRTVHATVPFTSVERNALRRDIELGNTAFDDERTIGEPELMDQWHEWLWMDEHETAQTSVEALGACALLAEGCVRIHTNLREVLGWDR